MRYAHEDQVTAMISGLRSQLLPLLDRPDVPDEVYEKAMEALVAAPEKFVTWSSDDQIANEYWDATNQD